MNLFVWLPCLFILFLVLYYEKKKNTVVTQHILNKKNRSRVKEMKELVKLFVGKECLINTINSQLQGVIKEVSDGGIIITNGENTEIINLEYVIRVREYPRGKNGKKKTFIYD